MIPRAACSTLYSGRKVNDGYCVIADEYNRVHRQWVGMCWICLILLASTATCGTLMLDYKQEAMEYRHALDDATSREIKEQARVDTAVKELNRRIEKLRR